MNYMSLLNGHQLAHAHSITNKRIVKGLTLKCFPNNTEMMKTILFE